MIMNLEARLLDITQRMLNIRRASVLDQFETILEKEEIVARTISGEPLTREMYKSKVLAAKEDIAKGNYTTQERLRQKYQK